MGVYKEGQESVRSDSGLPNVLTGAVNRGSVIGQARFIILTTNYNALLFYSNLDEKLMSLGYNDNLSCLIGFFNLLRQVLGLDNTLSTPSRRN